jgi:hypothetical protein
MVKCGKISIPPDGRILCFSELALNMPVGNIEDPPAGLNTSQRRQIKEWVRLKQIVRQVRDYFEVWSHYDGEIEVSVSFTGPVGVEQVHAKIRSNIFAIVEALKKAGVAARVDRWAQVRDRRFYPGLPTLEEQIKAGGEIIAHSDWVWKLFFEPKAGDDIMGILGFVAAEIEERTLSEHVAFAMPPGEPFI